jgi:hypothetical protein
MIDPTSRYANTERTTATLPDGRTVACLRRRFLPPLPNDPPTRSTTLSTIAVIPGERIDQLATRVIGDPLAFWVLSDVNPVLDPRELVASTTDGPPRRIAAPALGLTISVPGTSA